MTWISVKDRMPSEELRYYLVLSHVPCECREKFHIHRLNYRKFTYDVARWYKHDGENACFTECGLSHEEITHWMEFPEYKNELD